MSVAIPESGASPFDAIRRTRPDGTDYWSARELHTPLGYNRWERFTIAIDRAKVAAKNAGSDPEDHFRGSSKMVPLGSGSVRGIDDVELSRFAAYLVAMNGDPRKPEIASAQTYFAVKTREAETQAVVRREPTKLELARDLVTALESNEELAGRVKELEPSAQAWDVLASAHGDYSLRDAAHILNRDPGISTGQQRLMKTVRLFGMIDRNGVPYAKHSAHLTERPQTYTHPHTREEMLAKPQIRVTVQGLRYLHKKLGGVAPLRFEQLPFRDAG